MNVPNEWRQSKFIVHPRTGALRGSRSQKELSVGSRLVADRVGKFYTYSIRQYAHGQLLDLGCGKAPFLGYYAQFVDGATLVDWSSSIHENPLLDIEADLNQPLQIGDETYDTVILSDVLEHIAEPQALLGEVARVLRADGGVLLLNVPFYYPIHEEPFDFHRYTCFALDRMCIAAGLEVVDISATGGAPEIMADVSAKLIQRLPVVGRYIAALIQLAGERLTNFGPGRSISNSTARRFPLGYTVVAVKHGDHR